MQSKQATSHYQNPSPKNHTMASKRTEEISGSDSKVFLISKSGAASGKKSTSPRGLDAARDLDKHASYEKNSAKNSHLTLEKEKSPKSSARAHLRNFR